MRRSLVVVGLVVCLMGSGAWAISWQDYVGNWNDPCGWVDKRLPTGEEEVQIIGPNSVCTLNTSTGDWAVTRTDRLRVHTGATLVIEDGAELLGAGWMRVGSGGTTGIAIQTGGLVKLSKGRDSSRLGIGDSAGSEGLYTISGGTLTFGISPDGSILVGARGGKGKLVVVGNAATIVMDQLVVPNQAGASGTLEFQVGENGVSPIVINTAVKLDELADQTTSALVIGAIAAPPQANILLVDLKAEAAVAGLFDTVNGGPAPEGAPVVLENGNDKYFYHLTYVGGEGNNDIVLVFDRAEVEPVKPPIRGLVNHYTFEDGTAKDSVGGADGNLVGGAKVVGGSLVLNGTDAWMDMPGDKIAMNTFSEVSIEAWFTSVAGGNTGYHMLAAFGEEGTGLLTWAGYKYLFITPARGDNVSRAAIMTRTMGDAPWAAETGVSATVEHDDGIQHHFVATVNATDIAFFIDGELIGTKALDPNNAISGIGTAAAHVGKGVYPADPLWKGSVEEFNIYRSALTGDQILNKFMVGPTKD